MSEPLGVSEQLGLALRESALPEGSLPAPASQVSLRNSAFQQNKRDAVHRWVPWIAGFSAGFVADAFSKYLPKDIGRNATIVEPFAGVGTTLVEGLIQGFNVTGFEVNPWAALASRVKCAAYRLNPCAVGHFADSFRRQAESLTSQIDRAFLRGLDATICQPAPRATPPPGFSSRVPFFSPHVQRKVLHCLDVIAGEDDPALRELALLAFGAVMVSVSNYSYEPSLTSRKGAGKSDVLNADVVGLLADRLQTMADDIALYREQMNEFDPPPQARIIEASSLDLANHLPAASADLVVTSPPYLNNYHYIRNTRPHLFWLNFVAASADLRSIERVNFGTYWQTVRAAPPAKLVFALLELEQTIADIAQQHPEKGVYSGQGWANYATAYFNDCYRMANALRHVLRPGAAAVYVLGNSIVQGYEIPTDRFFGEIAEVCGLEFEGIEPLRTKRTGNSVINSSVRNGEPTRATLYETAVILRQPRA